MTKTIPVNLGNRSYEILTGYGILDQAGELLSKWNTGQKWIIITQSGPASRVGNRLKESLTSNGFSLFQIMLPDGEDAKSLAEIEKVYNQMIELECDRSSTLIALGGGVVGDSAGFVAATFMRGVSYVQIPTTLLSMVDSSIGGKTGVNLPHGKNLVGAIHQPLTVLTDISVLDSLPEREKVSGLGEIFKYGAISDRSFYAYLSNNLDDLIKGNKNTIEYAVETSCEIKAKVVVKDEYESGLRRILNFGHTIGHAIEKCGNFNEFRHGEAVIIGMKAAGIISHTKGLISSEELKVFLEPLQKLPVPSVKNLDINEIVKAVKQDKKVHSGKLHYILLESLGKARVDTNVSDEDIRNAWSSL